MGRGILLYSAVFFGLAGRASDSGFLFKVQAPQKRVQKKGPIVGTMQEMRLSSGSSILMYERFQAQFTGRVYRPNQGPKHGANRSKQRVLQKLLQRLKGTRPQGSIPAMRKP